MSHCETGELKTICIEDRYRYFSRQHLIRHIVAAGKETDDLHFFGVNEKTSKKKKDQKRKL